MEKRCFLFLTVLLLVSSMLIAQASKESDSEAKDKQVQIEYFNMKSETKEIMDEIIADFENENPNIKVIQTSTPDAETVFKTRLASRDIPDVTNVYPASSLYKEYYREGFLMNLDGQDFLNQVPDDVLRLSQADNENYSLPMTLSVYGLYIRTDLLEKYGLNEPTTYDELIHVCEVLQDNGIIPISFSDKATWTIGQILERLIGVINNDSDTEFRKIANGELNVLDSPSLNTFAKMMVELHKYSYDDTMAVSYEDSLADVANGKCAMVIMGSWALGTMATANPNIDSQINLIPFPNPTGGKTNVPINVDTAFSVSTATENQEASLKFLEFLSTTPVAQKYADLEKTPNIIKGVNYNVEPHRLLLDYLNNGDIFIAPGTIWPVGLRDQLKVPAQQLYIDGDIDSFLIESGKIIGEYYNN